MRVILSLLQSFLLTLLLGKSAFKISSEVLKLIILFNAVEDTSP